MRHSNVAQLPITCQGAKNPNLGRLALISLISFISFTGLLNPFPAEAKLVLKGEKIIQSDSRVIMEPGSVKTLKVGFKNNSKNIIWRNTGKNYASLYTVGPRYRKSPFFHKSWISK